MESYEAYGLIEEERSWQDVRFDEDGNPNTSFPYPPKFVRSEAKGELAERIRKAFAVTEEVKQETLEFEPVVLTEKTVYGGYSEYTQENLSYLKVQCGGYEKEFSDNGFDEETNSYYHSTLDALLGWLDKSES